MTIRNVIYLSPMRLINGKRIATEEDVKKAERLLKKIRHDPTVFMSRKKFYCKMIRFSYEHHRHINDIYFSVL